MGLPSYCTGTNGRQRYRVERIVQYVRDFEQAAETSPWVTRGNLWSIIVGCIDTDRRVFAVVGHAGRYDRSLLVSGRAFYNNKIDLPSRTRQQIGEPKMQNNLGLFLSGRLFVTDHEA